MAPALAQELLGDDPAAIVDALKAAIRAGAAPADLGRSLAYAAALRVARFGNANETSMPPNARAKRGTSAFPAAQAARLR